MKLFWPSKVFVSSTKDSEQNASPIFYSYFIFLKVIRYKIDLKSFIGWPMQTNRAGYAVHSDNSKWQWLRSIFLFSTFVILWKQNIIKQKCILPKAFTSHVSWSELSICARNLLDIKVGKLSSYIMRALKGLHFILKFFQEEGLFIQWFWLNSTMVDFSIVCSVLFNAS